MASDCLAAKNAKDTIKISQSLGWVGKPPLFYPHGPELVGDWLRAARKYFEEGSREMNQADYDRMHLVYRQFAAKVKAQCKTILRIGLAIVFLCYGLVKLIMV
jgi:hypothetical protein